MKVNRIEELEARIADLKKRWPKHSVSAALMQELDELEEELEVLHSAKIQHVPKHDNPHA